MNIGLFFCRGCDSGGRIDEVVDLDLLRRQFEGEALVQVHDGLCLTEAQREMLSAIDEGQLQGAVLASDSPHFYLNTLHRPVLERFRAAGLNPNRIAFANLNEQVAMPHRADPEGATAKAGLLVRVALEKVRQSHAMESVEIAPRRSVLIVGATIGGLLAAQRLVTRGYRVHLVEERQREAAFARLALGQLALPVLDDSPLMSFHFGYRLTDVHGWAGDFAAELGADGDRQTLRVGGVIIAVRQGDDPELTQRLHELLLVELGMDGHLRPRNATTLFTETREPGVFLIVTDNGIDDDALLRRGALRADSAVMALTALLEQDQLLHEVALTEVDPDLCGGCGTCVKTCAFNASFIDESKDTATVDVRRCKACGNCVTACPAAARDLITYPHHYLLSAIETLAQYPTRNGEPKVLSLLCDSCGYPAADDAGRKGCEYPASVLPLNVCCGGRVDTQYLLYAFRHGFDGIFVGRCHDEHCRNIVGDTDMDRRLDLFRASLRARRIDPERLRIWGIAPEEGEAYAEQVNDFVSYLRNNGEGN